MIVKFSDFANNFKKATNLDQIPSDIELGVYEDDFQGNTIVWFHPEFGLHYSQTGNEYDLDINNAGWTEEYSIHCMLRLYEFYINESGEYGEHSMDELTEEITDVVAAINASDAPNIEHLSADEMAAENYHGSVTNYCKEFVERWTFAEEK